MTFSRVFNILIGDKLIPPFIACMANLCVPLSILYVYQREAYPIVLYMANLVIFLSIVYVYHVIMS